MKAWWEEKEIEHRTGWLVGFRHLQVGYVEPGTRPHMTMDGYDYGEPPEWRTTGTVPCALVSFWPTQKPVHVPLDGYVALAKGRRYLDREWIRKGKRGALRTAPEPYSDAGGWATLSKETMNRFAQDMREEAKKMPRDEKGRWVKKP
jgi:hypothetical protein